MVKQRQLTGLNFSEDAVRQLLVNHKKLELIMENLHRKYKKVTSKVDHEQKLFYNKLFNVSLKQVFLQMKYFEFMQKNKVVDGWNQDTVVTQLKKELDSDTMIPEVVIGILTNDL